MTPERAEAAKAAAKALGWREHPMSAPPHDVLWDTRGVVVRLPAPDAPLHEHLEFVGRLAEALAPDFVLDEIKVAGGNEDGLVYSVDFMSTKYPGPGIANGGFGTGHDISWSALLAVAAARGTR